MQIHFFRPKNGTSVIDVIVSPVGANSASGRTGSSLGIETRRQFSVSGSFTSNSIRPENPRSSPDDPKRPPGKSPIRTPIAAAAAAA
ncbi:hypothetical protein NL676_015321 [Syzygium grande]|nr:hypothetical protein NL676_015321 [Syzygium grande]